MKYRLLLDLRLRHPFYENGRCLDFRVEPPPNTAHLLGRFRWVLKPTPDGVKVLCPVDDAGNPWVRFASAMSLVFHLRSRNSDFPLFTELAGGRRGQAFVYRDTSGTAPGGTLVPATEKVALPLPPGVFAQVDIQGISEDWLKIQPPSFTLEFGVKRAYWAYYVVAAKRNGAWAPRIVDDSPVAPLTFATNTLGDVATGLDRVADDLGRRYPGHARFRILSSDAIPCREASPHRLSLYMGEALQGEAADPLIAPLPTPSYRDYQALQRNSSDPVLLSLFRVVTLLPEPFSPSKA